MYSIADASTDSFSDQFLAIFKKKVLLTFRYPVMFFVLICIPVALYVGGLAFTLIGSGSPNKHIYDLSKLANPIRIFINTETPYMDWSTDKVKFTTITPDLNEGNIRKGDKELLVNFDDTCYINATNDTSIVHEGGFYTFSGSSGDANGKLYQIVTFGNIINPETLLVLSSALLNKMISNVNKDYTLKGENANIEVYEAKNSQVLEMVKSMLLGIYVAMGFGMLAGYVSVIIVTERVKGQKHQQLISGISLIAYWTSNIITDALILYIPMVIMICITPAFDISVIIIYIYIYSFLTIGCL